MSYKSGRLGFSLEKVSFWTLCLGRLGASLSAGLPHVVFTGFSRNASDIAEEQIKTIAKKTKELELMTEITEASIDILNSNRDNLKEFGKLLHESWKIKRGLIHLITTDKIDEIYDNALSAGAIGGKLPGAGGFIIFFVLPEYQSKIKERLKNLLYVPFRFEKLGSHIVLYTPQ